MLISLRSGLLVLSILLLVSCGFHLQGTDAGTLPPHIYLRGNDVSLNRVVSQQLQQRGTQVVQLAADAALAYPLLELRATEHNRQPLVLDQDGRVTRFDLQLRTWFRFSAAAAAHSLIPLQVSETMDSEVVQSPTTDVLEQSIWRHLSAAMSGLILTQLRHPP
jgi:outer membrane lipopolysaccharide assembly protein LptE/RlpB